VLSSSLFPQLSGLIKVHGVRSIRIQKKESHELVMAEVKVFKDDGTRFAMNGASAYMSNVHSSQFSASNCIQNNEDSTCNTGGEGHEGAYWEVDLGQDISFSKVQIFGHSNHRPYIRNCWIQLLDENGVILATAQTGSNLAGSGVFQKEFKADVFERNRCIQQCQDDMQEKLEGAQEQWRDSQPQPSGSSNGTPVECNTVSCE
jgi:hypothetical protein